jgi:hypothetical protein
MNDGFVGYIDQVKFVIAYYYYAIYKGIGFTKEYFFFLDLFLYQLLCIAIVLYVYLRIDLYRGRRGHDRILVRFTTTLL